VEAAKERADQIYKNQIQSTTEYTADKKLITATVTPLFGSGEPEAREKQKEKEKKKEKEEEEEGDDEEVADEGDVFQGLEKQIKNTVQKTKPKRKPKRSDDGGKGGKRKRGGGLKQRARKAGKK
jgi:hypothetical protein